MTASEPAEKEVADSTQPYPDVTGWGRASLEQTPIGVVPRGTVPPSGTAIGPAYGDPAIDQMNGSAAASPTTPVPGYWPAAPTGPDREATIGQTSLDQTPSTPIPPRYASSPPVAARGRWSRTTLVIVSVACALALVLAGSGVVWALNRVPASAPPAPVAPVSPASVGQSPFSSPSAAAPESTMRSASGMVQVEGAAAAHPLARPVTDLLDRHFAAINTRDFSTWTSTVAAQRAADQTDSQWLRDYRSTWDSDVRVDSITETGRGVTVALRFTSEQDIVDAPSDLPVSKICWSSRWPITGLPSAGVIGTAPKGTTTREAC